MEAEQDTETRRLQTDPFGGAAASQRGAVRVGDVPPARRTLCEGDEGVRPLRGVKTAGLVEVVQGDGLGRRIPKGKSVVYVMKRAHYVGKKRLIRLSSCVGFTVSDHFLLYSDSRTDHAGANGKRSR